MPTYSKVDTNSPFLSNFYVATVGASEPSAGTYTQDIATVPAGQALVIKQFYLSMASTAGTIDKINGPSSYAYQVSLTASSAVAVQNIDDLVLGPGAYTFTFILPSPTNTFTWKVVGYYVSINT